MSEFTVTCNIEASIEEVWTKMTDHEGMVDWSPLVNVTLEQEGNPDRNGLGAIRAMKSPAGMIREEVTEWSPPNHYAYAIRSGAPFKDHLGTVSLRKNGTHTTVIWNVRFQAVLPGLGWLLSAGLKRTIDRMLKQLRILVENSATNA